MRYLPTANGSPLDLGDVSVKSLHSELGTVERSGQTLGLRRLTRSPEIDGTPVWSPGGGRIAFTSRRDGNYEVYVMNADGGNRDIYVMNADGSGQRNLTRNPAADLFAAWSPDGRRIVFHSDRPGQPARRPHKP